MADIYPVFLWMLPECTLDAPEEGHIYPEAPANIIMEVTATSSFGEITLVEFFIDNGTGPVKVGEVPTGSNPYTFTIAEVDSGNYSLFARATNTIGAQTLTQIVNVEVQGANVRPICEITTPPYETITTFVEGTDILIRANATDTDGIITKVEFFVDDIKVGEDTLVPYSFRLTDVQIGTHVLTAIATDNKGATSIPQYPVTILVVPYVQPLTDRIPPITTSDIPSDWNRHRNFIIELVANDFSNTEHDVPAGLLRTYYTLDGTQPTTSSSFGPNQPDNKTTKISIQNRQGQIEVQYFSVDLMRQAEGLGNTERTRIDTLKLDDTAPITTYSTLPVEPDGSNDWFKTNPTITLIATDSVSGIYRTFYRFNGSAFQTYTGPFTLPGQGIYTLQCYSEDNAGNVEDIKTYYFKWDLEPPFTQDDILPGVYREPKTINFFTSDLYSGTDKTYFTLDGSTPTTQSTSGSSVTITESGTYTVKYFSVDIAGNAETPIRENQIAVFIDIDGPKTYIFENIHINGVNGWYKSSPEISIVAIDPSGVKDIQYKLYEADQTTTAKYTSTVDISSTVDLSVNHFIKLEIDQSGELFEIDIQGVIPRQTTITEIISSINAIVGQDVATETNAQGTTGNGYVTITSPTAGTGSPTSEVKFLPIASDATNEVFGLDETEYPHIFTETVVFESYTTPITIPTDNYWNLEYYSVDNEDNKSATGTKSYKLDTESPVTVVHTSYDPDGTNGWYVTPPEPGQHGGPEITLEATDNLSGVQKIYYKWDGGHWEEFKSGDIIYIPGEGNHVLRVYAVDFAGNEEIEQQITFKYDYSAPTTTDDTLKYQGVIYTARGSGHQQVPEENPLIVGPYNLKLRNVDVVAVPYIWNVTKSQEYVLEQITGVNRDIIQVAPIVRDENSSRLDDFRIQLLGLGGNPLSRFDDVYKICNKTTGKFYTIDQTQSDLNGNLVLKGLEAIELGDVLSVDYSFSGIPLSVGDIVNVSYSFDVSHDAQVLNTLDYTFIDPSSPPYTIDHDITVHLIASDTISSIAHTYYTIDGSEPTINSLEGTSIDFTEPGTYTIKYFSIDAAGNSETPHEAQYQIRIDKRIPQLDIDFELDPLEDGENGWFKYDFGLNIHLWSDDRVDRIDEQVSTFVDTGFSGGYYTYRLTLDNDFIKSVARIKSSISNYYYEIVDYLPGSGFYNEIAIRGLNSIPINESFLVDYRHFIGLEKVNLGSDSSNLDTEIQISSDLSKFDATSFITDKSKVQYNVILPATPEQFFLHDGYRTVYARAYDRNTVLGTGAPQKQSNLYSLPYKLDRIAPVTSDDGPVIPVGTWVKSPVLVNLFPFDEQPGSGISATHYTTNGTTPTRSSQNGTSIWFTTSGSYDVKYFSVDFAGNSETVKACSSILNVDADAPLTSIIVTPSIPDGENFWYKTIQPQISFTAVDLYSGVEQTYYKINDGVFTVYTGPFLLDVEGEVSITYYSVDVTGNIETEKIAIVKYDHTAPVTTTDAPVGYTSNSRINFFVEDTGSGLYRTYYTTDGSDPTTSSNYGAYVDFISSGVYTLKYFSVDNAGNTEAIKSQTVQIDLESPEIYEFLPEGCIIDDSTTQIVIRIRDTLSGVDIDSVTIDVDGVVYSTSKNSTYFSYSGTSADYTITLSPITDLLNFSDVELLRVNVSDFAGNATPTLEFNLVRPDTLSPWVREVYPAPNVQDVSTSSNVIAFIDDSQSGVEIKSVIISINDIDFKVNSKNVLKVLYMGDCTTATLQILNRSLTTYIDSVKDVSISFNVNDYNTIKKIELYLNSLPGYVATILDSRYEQTESVYLLNVNNLDIVNDGVVDFYLPEENLNFSFFERGKGYIVFASPNFNYAHKVPVSVSINAQDSAGNVMETFLYVFIPHIYATPSIKKRNQLNRVALEYLDDMQANMASNYSRSKSTKFYGHQKAISLELARHEDEINYLNEDRSYVSLRAPYLYTKLGYLLETLPQDNLSHDDYRRLLQSLISILFKGSLKSSIEEGVSLFLGTDVKIIEVVFAENSDISEQFVFTADIMVTNTFTGVDLIAISKDMARVFNLVKPAHVFIVQRFGWVDEFDFQAGCELLWEVDEFGNQVIDQFGKRVPQIADDGYQAAVAQSDTAICDRFKYNFNNRYEENVRQDCAESLARINTYVDDVSSQFTGTENYFYVSRIPMLQDSTHVATTADVEVNIDGIPVAIEEMDPLTGFIRLTVTPSVYQVVTVSYKYNQYFIYRVVTMFLWNENGYDTRFSGNSQYFHIMGSNDNEFMLNNGLADIEIEGVPLSSQQVVIGRIKIPEVQEHAHVCDTLMQQISTERSESKEPIMLNEVVKKFSPESGKPDEISFTYLNDTNYTLNSVSIMNKKCLVHDSYEMTLTP